MVTESPDAHHYAAEEFSEKLHVLFEKYFSSRSPEDFKELVNYCADSILEAYARLVEDGEHAYDIMGTLRDEGERGNCNRALFLAVGRVIATRLSVKQPMQTMEAQQKEEE